MGIKNARKKSHRTVGDDSADDGMWQEGTFKPASDSKRDKTIYTPIKGLDGLPTEARIIHVEWKKGSELQKFYGCIQVGYDPDAVGSIDVPDDDVDDDMSDRQDGRHGWRGAEVDCTHGVCHIHPNGHYPPSGVPEPKIPIKRLSPRSSFIILVSASARVEDTRTCSCVKGIESVSFIP